MRILFLITTADIGGAQKYVFLNAKKLKKEGNEVILGAGGGGWLSEELKKWGIPFFIFKNLKRSLNPVYALLFVFELRKFIKERQEEGAKIDAIHINSSNPLFGVWGLMFLKYRPKIIFTMHGLSYLSPGFKKNPFVKFFVWLTMKISLSFVDDIIFVCDYDLKMARKINLIGQNRGRVVYNEVEPINFLDKNSAISELRKIKNFPPEKIIIGTITRFEYAKNNEFLMEAISKLPKEILDKIVCLIIGDGPERENLKLQISKLKLGDKIFLLGPIPEASRFLKAFDIFTITSRYEGVPYVLLEAMLAGLPIIAPEVGGIPEIIKENQYLFKPNDIKSFIEKISNLISRMSGGQPLSS